MAIIFNLPDNYDYHTFQQHVFNEALHFGSGEKDSYGNISFKGKVNATEFIGKGANNPTALTGGDFNKILNYGEYYSAGGYSYANGPGGKSYVLTGVLKVFRMETDDNYVIQLIIDSTGPVWHRKVYALDPTNTSYTTEWFRVLDENDHVTKTNLHLTENDRDILSKSLPVRHTIDLTVNGWNNNSQTVDVPGVNTDEGTQLITIVPSNAAASAYRACEVYATEQEQDKLTFACTTIPQKTLTIFITIQEVSDGASA